MDDHHNNYDDEEEDEDEEQDDSTPSCLPLPLLPFPPFWQSRASLVFICICCHERANLTLSRPNTDSQVS